MKKLILFFLLPFQLWGSSADSLRTAVKANIFSPIDVFTFPTFNISLEQRLTSRYSVNATFGPQLYSPHYSDTAFIHPSGFKAILGFRSYLSKKDPNGNRIPQCMKGGYIGVEFFYRDTRYNRELYYYNKNDSMHWTDCFWLRKQSYGMNFLFGIQKPFLRHMLIDIYYGLGLSGHHNSNGNMEFGNRPGDFIAGTDLVPWFAHMDLPDSNHETFISMRFGLELGYHF